jgi:hypothetical protein
MEFGNVQRAILGVEGGELNATASRELELTKPKVLYWCGRTKLRR